MDIAVIGSGISGLSAAWMLSKHHSVDLFEKDDRLGGHANTQSIDTQQGPIDIDTGFIVYNEKTYPNLTALFDHIGVQTAASDMSFSASLSDGMREYSGQGLRGLLAQPSNMVSPRFYRMLRDIYRFYNEATTHAGLAETRNETLGSYLTSRGYSKAFIHDHLLPMGAAIWSMPSDQMLDFPFEAFMRFSINHGLVQFQGSPPVAHPARWLQALCRPTEQADLGPHPPQFRHQRNHPSARQCHDQNPARLREDI